MTPTRLLSCLKRSRFIRLLACGAFLVCVPGLRDARAQVTLDNTSSAAGAAANVLSLTWSHTVGAGTNRILIVGVSIVDGGATVTGVTYSGQALTLIGGQTAGASTDRIEMWRLLAPPVGTASIVVTLSAAKRIVGGAVSYTGVDQTTPLGACVS